MLARVNEAAGGLSVGLVLGMLKSFYDKFGVVKVSPLLCANSTEGVASDPVTLRRVAAAQTELLYEMDRGSGFRPVIVFLIATLLMGDLSTAIPWAAFAVYCSSWVYFHGLQAEFLADQARAQSPEVWSRRFAIASMMTGAAWGMGSAAWFSLTSVENQAVVALIMLGVGASSAISRAMHTPSMLAFAVPSAAPVMLSLVITAQPFGMLMAVLGFIFLSGLLAWSKSLQTSQLDSIALRFQNESLVRSLKAEREVAMTAKREAEAGSRAKTEFLTTISHEVRTPLNGILGMAHILQTSDLNPEQQEHMDIIVESGETLQTILNDILDLSKLEAGRFDVDAAPFDVLPVVNSVARLFRSNAESKGLELDIQTDMSTKVRAQADDHRARQILLNLVGNAIKFTESGRVDICFAPVGSTLLPAGLPGDLPHDHVVVAVTDTGIGVPRERMGQLFQPFTQADQSTTRKYGGTGLGLAISKRLVELMGGRIGGISAPGEGSTFWFSLPAASVDSGEGEVKAAHATTPNQGRRILLAEDNDVNAMVATALMEQQHHQVTRVKDGEAAVAYVKAQLESGAELPDAVLMDIRMPKLSGPEAAAQIRALPAPADKLPILALTADLSQSEVRSDGTMILPKEYIGTFDGALSKPITPDHLEMAIAAATSAEISLSGAMSDGDVVNLAHLNGILDILGNTAFADLIQTYVGDLEQLSSELASALESDNREKAAEISHSLVGASANLGFVALEAASREMMKAAKSDDAADISDHHRAFNNAVEDTRRVVNSLKSA